MPTYDDVQFDPPAPVACVSLRCPQTGTRSGNVALLVDWEPTLRSSPSGRQPAGLTTWPERAV